MIIAPSTFNPTCDLPAAPATVQANATIAAAVGTVVLGGRTGVPVLAEIKADNIAGLMPRRAVVITTSGGPEIVGQNDLARARMDVRCYGKDVADCWALNDAVYAELRYNRPQAIEQQARGLPLPQRRRDAGLRPRRRLAVRFHRVHPSHIGGQVNDDTAVFLGKPTRGLRWRHRGDRRRIRIRDRRTGN